MTHLHHGRMCTHKTSLKTLARVTCKKCSIFHKMSQTEDMLQKSRRQLFPSKSLSPRCLQNRDLQKHHALRLKFACVGSWFTTRGAQTKSSQWAPLCSNSLRLRWGRCQHAASRKSCGLCALQHGIIGNAENLQKGVSNFIRVNSYYCMPCTDG